MAAISSPRAPLDVLGAAGRRAALSLVGIVGVGLLAFTVPVLLGLMAAGLLHVLRLSAGRLPVAQLLAVNLLDTGLLVVVGAAAWRSWERYHQA
jgi:hypothetical protein